MSRCRSIATVVGVPGGLAAAAHAQSSITPTPRSESGNPTDEERSNDNYRSTITRVNPGAPDLSLERPGATPEPAREAS